MLNRFKSVVLSAQFKKLTVYGFGQLFNLVTPLLIVPYVVGICGEENFGKTAIGMSIAFFMIVFVDFGSDIVGVKQISTNRNNPKELNRIISINYILKLVLLLLCIIISFVLFSSLEYFRVEKKLFLLSLTIVIGQFLNPSWILQGLENFKVFSFLNVVSKSVYMLLVFVLVKNETDYVWINFFFGIGTIVSSIIVLFYMTKYYKIKLILVSKNELIEYFNSHKTFVFSQIFTWIQLYSPVILLSFVGSKLIVGQFRIIDQILSIFKTYIILSFNFIFPKICFDLNDNIPKGINRWKLFNGVSLCLVVILLSGVYIFSFELVDYFNTTNKYFLDNLLKVSLLYPIAFFMVFVLKQLLLAVDENKLYSRTTIFMSILNVAGILIGYKIYGLTGVFYSFILIELLTCLLFFLILRKKTNYLG